MHENRPSCEVLSNMSIFYGHFTARCNFWLETDLITAGTVTEICIVCDYVNDLIDVLSYHKGNI
jgi:hypothetical protein